MVTWGKYAKGRKNMEGQRIIFCASEFVNKYILVT